MLDALPPVPVRPSGQYVVMDETGGTTLAAFQRKGDNAIYAAAINHLSALLDAAERGLDVGDGR
mgnify:FL=1